MISTRNPLNTNVKTQKRAAKRFATPRKDVQKEWFVQPSDKRVPVFLTVAETKKHSDDAQTEEIQTPKKKMKNFAAVR